MDATGTATDHAPGTPGPGARLAAAADVGIAQVAAREKGVRVLAGAARYGVATLLSLVLHPVLAAVVYAVLLVWATLTDQPTGGPLGLPVLVLVGALVGVVLTGLAVAVCAAAEVVGRRARAPRLLVAACSIAAVAVLAAALGAALAGVGSSTPPVLPSALGAAVASLPAALVVVGVAQSGGALTNVALRAVRRWSDRRGTATP